MDKINIDKPSSHISFVIENEHFAIEISKVIEILQVENLTKVPNASEFIEGILNFRGEIVPVINLQKRFNFKSFSEEGQIVIVVEVPSEEKLIRLGLLVNDVTDVIEIKFRDIRTVPELGINYNPAFLEGFVEVSGQITMILDVNKVLNITELATTNKMTKGMS